MRKTTGLALLICVNLVLITGILLIGSSPRTANAQGTSLAGNYLLVSGEIQDEFDALYLLDLRERTLHTFYFEKGTRTLTYGKNYRSLDVDFRQNTE